MVELNCSYIGVFQVRIRFRWWAATRNPFLGLSGNQGNINFSGTTTPKVHQHVWNSSLGTGLGRGGVELQLFWVLPVRRGFRWWAATRETRFLGLSGNQGNINFSETTTLKVHQHVWNSSLGTGLGDGEFKRWVCLGITSQNPVSVVGSNTRNPIFEIVGKGGKY